MGTANPQNLNRYSYVANNPLTHTDPSGHDWEHFKDFIIGVGEGAYTTLQSAAKMSMPQGAMTAGAKMGFAFGSDPAGFVQGVKDKVNTVIQGGKYALNDPSGAVTTLYENSRGLGQVMGTALGTAALAETGKIISGPTSGTQLYRAVSEAEFQDLQTVKMFRPGGISVEGKYFAEAAGDAGKWGDLMLGKGNYRVVGGNVAETVPNTRWDRLDRIGPARFYEAEQLPQIKYTGEVP